MFRLFCAVASALCVVSIATTGAFADPAAPDTPTAPSGTSTATSSTTTTTTSTVPVPDPNKVICHREEVTGSNMASHICKTRAEWARLADEHKLEIDNYERQHRISGCGSKGC